DRGALVREPAAAEDDRLVAVLALQMKDDRGEAAAALERRDEGACDRTVARAQQLEKRHADQILGVAAVEVLGGPGDERDGAVARPLDQEVGGGEGKADEPVALPANRPENGFCRVECHGAVRTADRTRLRSIRTIIRRIN